jgi:hypothetical protein
MKCLLLFHFDYRCGFSVYAEAHVVMVLVQSCGYQGLEVEDRERSCGFLSCIVRIKTG